MTSSKPLFVSYGSAEAANARKLVDVLTESVGRTAWFDAEQIRSGDDFVSKLNIALRDASGLVAVFGRYERGRYAVLELNVALDVEQEAANSGRRFPVVPVVVPGHPVYPDGRIDRSRWPPLLRTHRYVDLTRGFDDALALDELSDAFAYDAPSESEELPPPYPGLRSYVPQESEQFFGRNTDIERLLALTQERRLLVLAGSSGSGKSSLVQAGLIPALDARTIPVQLVSLHRSEISGRDPVASLLLSGPSAAAQGRGAGDSASWLILDQFEDLFVSYTVEEQTHILTSVERSVSSDDSKSVLLVLRSDFLGELAVTPLGEHLGGGLCVLQAMDETALRSAIEQPAFAEGVGFEPGLVERLIADVGGRAGALPLLNDALRAMWRWRRDDLLTLNAYETEIGGIGGPLKDRADAVLANLHPDEQSILRFALLRLAVTRGGLAPPVGRVRRLTDLTPATSNTETVRLVLETLVSIRMLLVDGDADSARYSVVHDVVFTAWPVLAGWLDQHEADFPTLEGLARTAEEWERSGRDDGLLVEGKPLANFEAIRQARPEALTETEIEFTDLSSARLKVRERSERSRRLLARGVALSLVVVVVVGVIAAVAIRERSAAVAAREETLALRLVAEARALLATERDTSLLLAAEAATRSATSDTISVLQDAMALGPIPTREVFPAAMLPTALGSDGMSGLAVGRANGILSLPAGAAVMVADQQALLAVAGSRDGAVATLDQGGVVRLVTRDHDVHELGRVDLPVAIAANGRSDRVLAWGFESAAVLAPDRTAQLISFTRPTRASTATGALSADGRVAYLASDETILAADLDSANPKLVPFADLATPILSMSVDNTSNTLAVAASDGSITFFGPGGDELPDRIRGPSDGVFAIEFDPNGSLIAGTDASGRLFVWDVGTRSQVLGPLVSYPSGTELDAGGESSTGSQREVVFESPERIATISEDAIVIWDLSVAPGLVTGPPVAIPDGVADIDADDEGGVTFVTSSGMLRPEPLWWTDEGATAVLASGRGLVVGYDSGLISENGVEVAFVGGPVTDIVGSADGDVVVATTDQSVDLVRPFRSRLLSDVHTTAIAVHAGASALAIAVQDPEPIIRQWRLSDSVLEGSPIDPGHSLVIDALTYLPDGNLASGSDDRTIRVSSPDGVTEPIVLRGHTDGVLSVAAAGTDIWSAAQDGYVIRWMKETDGRYRRMGQPIPVATSGVQLALGGDVLWVASQAQAHQWVTTVNDMVDNACRMAGRTLSQAELLEYELHEQKACFT